MFQAVVQEASSTKAVCLMDPGEDVELNITVLHVIHFTVVALQEVTRLTTVHCFCQCDCGCELNLDCTLSTYCRQ
jgi:hypothetical protein